MIKARLLVALLLCFGISFSQDRTSGDSDPAPEHPFRGIEALRAEIGLNERQIERLREIGFALEDAIFPYALEAFEKDWALRRELRGTPPNVEVLRMLGEDLERIIGEVERVHSEHRAASRALLSSHQNAALDRLARVFESVQAAQEAIRLNLIEPPHGFPEGLLLFGPFGRGGFGPFGGLFGLLAEQPSTLEAAMERIGEGR